MKTKGLTLKEAVESGKPFRRGLWERDVWLACPRNGYIVDVEESHMFTLSTFDIFATDWEIKAEPREFWIIKNGDVCGGNIFENRDAIDAYFALKGLQQAITGDPDLDGREIIHVREVI